MLESKNLAGLKYSRLIKGQAYDCPIMSTHEVKLFEANFNVWKADRGAGLSDSKAFERYVVEQVLKDFDLSNDSIESGDLGGEDDGGVDSVYLFMNTTLITLETPPIVPAGPIELHLIQAKYEKGFGETAVQKLESFAKDLLSYDKPVDGLKYLNSRARDAIKNFREKYSDEVMGNPHTLAVKFHYACKAATAPGPKDKVSLRAQNLVNFVKGILSSAEVTFTPWTAKRLLETARTVPESDVVIPVSESFSTGDGSTVCLIKLKDYAEKLLTNSEGGLQTRFLEPNVRDYNGKSNPVNKQIRATLDEVSSASQEDFWWLNNGITILADECPVNGHKIKIKNPEVVNGLQTSHEIFEWYNGHKKDSDTRNVLVRVVVPADEKSRSKIIKATNSQTPVSMLSLMATDQIQEDIEDRLRLYGLFYDRKKGEYRRLKKPIKKIVGMGTLAQAVIAIALQKPDEARGRPETFVKNHADDVFHPDIDRDLYAACILIDRQVKEYLHGQNLEPDELRDIRYYVDLIVGEEWNLASRTTDAIAEAIAAVVKPISVSVLNKAKDKALKIYKELGATDVIAKSLQMREKVLA
ncbi:MAG TPA: AIPR family protein [Candidatus Angelobacter sp.]|nr:AIPR family protein [Candidatus Angelobacter sp.]